MQSLIKKLILLNLSALIITLVFITGCQHSENSDNHSNTEIPEYFSLRPDVEKAYGYTHAVKIGSNILISGAVSMDDEGNPTAVGDLLQQMKNCYAD